MSDQLSDQSPRDLYDSTASRWVRDQPLSLSDYTARPAVLALCQPLENQRVLDLGCGEGYCTRQLRRMGAREVIGIDISGGMIDAAKTQEQREPLGITYFQGDGADLSAHQEGAFDLVLAMFMFNYLMVAEMGRCMAQVARVLRPGGRFVFAVPHPAFPFMRKAGPPFYFDVGGHGYFSGRDIRFPGQIWKRDHGHLDVQACHKVIEDYIGALSCAGFDRMPILRELRVTKEMLAIDPPFFTPILDIPIHLALSVTR